MVRLEPTIDRRKLGWILGSGPRMTLLIGRYRQNRMKLN
jgi:hypothetical protein